MKINVFRENHYSVNFEMSEDSDGLPERGEYFLIPVKEIHIFVANYLQEQTNIMRNTLEYRFSLTRFEEALTLLNEKINLINKGEK